MSAKTRAKILASLSDEEKVELLYCWPRWARPEQLPPEGDWRTWLILAGRGWGKTKTGAEWVRSQIESGRCRRMAAIAPTAADVRDVMVEGESGLMAVCPPWNRPLYEPSKRRLTWPSGGIVTCYSADEPERGRGPQHDGLWADEVGSWRYPEAWDIFMFGLRMGGDPRAVVTTTPKPIKLIKELVQAPTTTVTRGTSFENRRNLAPAFFDQIVKKYEGTRLGRQELLAEILDDNPNALWTRSAIEASRRLSAPDLERVVVAIDPAVTNDEGSAETGIVVAGRLGEEYFVLEDRSLRASPRGWASEAIVAYKGHKADRIIGEANNGGDMIEGTLRNVDGEVSFTKVHASRGKITRAEPIAALYEQGRVHHVGMFLELEDQMTEWEPGLPSPDRLDALVWALTELSTGGPDFVPYAFAGPARSIR